MQNTARRLHITRRSTAPGFISVQAAAVLAVIVGSAGLLTYEWHQAHAGKSHHNAAPAHHHHAHDATTSADH